MWVLRRPEVTSAIIGARDAPSRPTRNAALAGAPLTADEERRGRCDPRAPPRGVAAVRARRAAGPLRRRVRGTMAHGHRRTTPPLERRAASPPAAVRPHAGGDRPADPDGVMRSIGFALETARRHRRADDAGGDHGAGALHRGRARRGSPRSCAARCATRTACGGTARTAWCCSSPTRTARTPSRRSRGCGCGCAARGCRARAWAGRRPRRASPRPTCWPWRTSDLRPSRRRTGSVTR